MYFSNHKPLIDNPNVQGEKPYFKNYMSKFHFDPTAKETGIVILPR